MRPLHSNRMGRYQRSGMRSGVTGTTRVWVCNYVRPGAGSASGLISVAAGSRLGPASPLRLTPEINLAFSGEPAKTMR
jgi:hypothetical protein